MLKKRLDDSPSLNSKLESIYQVIYPDAEKSVSKLFNLPQAAKITLEQALDDDWFVII